MKSGRSTPNSVIPPVSSGLPHKITIMGVPKAQQRPRLGRHGGFYSPSSADQKALGSALFVAMRQTRIPKLLGPLKLELSFYGSGRPDLSNLVKLFEDAANGILWDDDRQVIELQATMVRKDAKPRTEMTVFELP